MSEGVAELRDRIAALEQHISELEKSLENVRKERDEHLATLRGIASSLGFTGPGEDLPEAAQHVREQRDAALADNAAVVERLRAALTEEGARAFVAGRESRDDEVKRLEKALDRIAREDVDNPYSYARMALEDGH